MKILLIDDEPIILSSLRKAIFDSKLNSITVLSANNAVEAYSIITNERPEIIVTDIQMPQENGIHLLKRIVDLSYSPLVIFITGYADFSYMQSAIQYNAFDYLLKPIQNDIFIDCLKRAITEWQKRFHTQKLNSLLSEFYNKNINILMSQYLESMLISPLPVNGGLSKDQIITLGFNFNLFCIIGIKCIPNTSTRPINQECYVAYTLSRMLSRLYPKLTSCHIGSYVYVFYPLQNLASVDSEVSGFAEKITNYVNTELLSSIIICISNPESDFNSISNLNKQIQYCFTAGQDNLNQNSNIIFYEDIADSEPVLPNLNDYIFQLINSIRLRDLESSKLYSHEFFIIIRNMELDVQKNAMKILELNLNCQLRNAISDPIDLGYLTGPITRYCLDNPVSEDSISIFNNCISNIIQELSNIYVTSNSQIISKSPIVPPPITVTV